MSQNEENLIDIQSQSNTSGVVSPIETDTIVSIAAAAERRIDAVNKIKVLALRVTNEPDWVDQGGRPYLQSSGAEKVARLFGISWQIFEPELQIEEDGHFMYIYKGLFSFGTVTIEVIGTRSSRDDFFSHKGKIPPSEIDKGDIRKSAYTNLTANGITRLIGIRNLTYDDLKKAGLDITKISKIEYNKGEMSHDSKSHLEKIKEMLVDLYGENIEPELEKLTSFTAKDGKFVPGVKSLQGLSEKRVEILYGKLKVLCDKSTKNNSTGANQCA